jgi:hypothetical protein
MPTVPSLRHESRQESVLPPHWSRSIPGRVVLGLLLSQGLYYGLHYALAEWISYDDPEYEVVGFSVAHLFQMGTILVAALLAGAGQTTGAICGTLIGVVSSVLFTLTNQLHGLADTPVRLYAPPLIAINVGLVFGWLGSCIWSPPQIMNLSAIKEDPSVPTRVRPKIISWQIHWFRVAIGAAVLAAGIIWTPKVIGYVIAGTAEELQIESYEQRKVVTLWFAGLAVMFGTMFAGARTWNGALQGACAVMFAVLLLVGRLVSYGPMDPLKFLTTYAGGIQMLGFALMTVAMLAIGLASGWFGSRMLIPSHRPRR